MTDRRIVTDAEAALYRLTNADVALQIAGLADDDRRSGQETIDAINALLDTREESKKVIERLLKGRRSQVPGDAVDLGWTLLDRLRGDA